MARRSRHAPIYVTNKKGKRIRLLDPAERGSKFAYELKHNAKFTNDGNPKVTKYGEVIRLSEKERAYRSGYLASRKDNAKCYNAQKKKGGVHYLTYTIR